MYILMQKYQRNEAEILEQEMELTASAMILQTPGEKEYECDRMSSQ